MRKYRISEICSGTREGRRPFLSFSPSRSFFSLYICNKGYKRRQLYDWLSSQCFHSYLGWYCSNFRERHLPLRNFFTQYVFLVFLYSRCSILNIDQNFKLLAVSKIQNKHLDFIYMYICYNVPGNCVVLYVIQTSILHTIMESIPANLMGDARSFSQ